MSSPTNKFFTLELVAVVCVFDAADMTSGDGTRVRLPISRHLFIGLLGLESPRDVSSHTSSESLKHTRLC